MNAKMISPTGKLIGVSQAVPVVEKVFKFNGRVQRMSERTDVFKGVKPNAISIRTENCANFMFQNELIIGMMVLTNWQMVLVKKKIQASMG